MKQTSLFPFCNPTTPKKSPIPAHSKPTDKSSILKSISKPIYTIVNNLSPLSKRNFNNADENQDAPITPIKPENTNTKRRSRGTLPLFDSFLTFIFRILRGYYPIIPQKIQNDIR